MCPSAVIEHFPPGAMDPLKTRVVCVLMMKYRYEKLHYRPMVSEVYRVKILYHCRGLLCANDQLTALYPSNIRLYVNIWTFVDNTIARVRVIRETCAEFALPWATANIRIAQSESSIAESLSGYHIKTIRSFCLDLE